MTLTVRDENASGDTLHEFALELLTEPVTVRELIRSRARPRTKRAQSEKIGADSCCGDCR